MLGQVQAHESQHLSYDHADIQLGHQAAALRAPDLPGPQVAIQRLQRAIGNRAASYILQAKPSFNQPSDEYEQEADQVATQVMRMPNDSEPPLQRKCSCGGELEPDGEECEACRNKRLALQRRSTSHNKPHGVPPTVHD